MIIEFGTRKNKLYEKRLARFEELKPKNFMQSLEPWEEAEFDEIYNWLQIHK